jgi:holin-like protein
MLNTLALLLLYQLGGELVARFFGLPIPGPVIGMTLLLLTLLARGQVSHDTRTNVGAFLQHMSLFFVPAGVGVMVHLHRVAAEWLPIVVSLVVSTFAGIAVTAWVIRAMSPKKGSPSNEEARP